jgi:signal transduction histidine kinase
LAASGIDPERKGGSRLKSGLADFIEFHIDAIVEQAIAFARTVEVGKPLDVVELRDHLPDIIEKIVADLRTSQTRAQEIEKSEGRAQTPLGQARSAAATHALHRAHSGYSVSDLVSEYRALRASVLRLWADRAHEASARPEEITRFNEAIDEAIAESVCYYAEEVERWRNIFLGVLSHDLRSPLSAIVLTSEVIARTAVDLPMVEAAQRLLRSGQRMRELLDKLLVYNRVQMGIGFEIERAEVDLVSEIGAEIELLQASMPGARIRLQSPPLLRGRFDAGHVREALSNLVVNAHKYGTRGGPVDVKLHDTGGGAELTVANPGEPISQETLDVMFEPLRRGSIVEDEHERASLGLGLFIVDQIAKAHGGAIEVESTAGTTTFTMHLPKN